MSCEILLCHYRMINLNVETRVLSGKGLFFFSPSCFLPVSILENRNVLTESKQASTFRTTSIYTDLRALAAEPTRECMQCPAISEVTVVLNSSIAWQLVWREMVGVMVWRSEGCEMGWRTEKESGSHWAGWLTRRIMLSKSTWVNPAVEGWKRSKYIQFLFMPWQLINILNQISIR